MSPRPADPARLSETYKAIEGFIGLFGYPPTLRQLGNILGLSSSSSVKDRLDSLEKAGMVERVPGSPRAIILKDPKASAGPASSSGKSGTGPAGGKDQQ